MHGILTIKVLNDRVADNQALARTRGAAPSGAWPTPTPGVRVEDAPSIKSRGGVTVDDLIQILSEGVSLATDGADEAPTSDDLLSLAVDCLVCANHTRKEVAALAEQTKNLLERVEALLRQPSVLRPVVGGAEKPADNSGSARY